MEKENEKMEEREKQEEKTMGNHKENEKEQEESKSTENENDNAINEKDVKKIKQEEIKEDKKEKNIGKTVFVFLTFAVIVVILISTIFAITNMNNEKIIKGVYVEQVDVQAKDNQEINKMVSEKISLITEVSVKYGEYSEIIKTEDMGIKIEANDAIQKAISYGKTGNIVVDNYQILFARIFQKHYDLTINIDEEKFNTTVKNIQAEIPDALKEYSYEIQGEELIINNGTIGDAIITEEFKKRLVENIKEQFNNYNENLSIEIPTKKEYPKEIDIEKIYKEIYKEAKNAYIVDEPFELFKEENGVELGITIDEAKELLLEEKDTYKIPLKITKPEIAVKDLGDKLFKQSLAKYTTIYDAGNYNRAHNVALAAKTINGTILLPGETFSYNGTLGNTNAAKGYKQATAYAGGKVVQSYGGGICQVSSTLYNAVLYANLEIVERYNHSYVVSYVPAGRDATVAYGGKDFKFKNTRQYPIKIVASAKNGVVSISIMGIKEETEYEVVLTSSVLSTKARTVIYENNSSLAEGTEKVIQKGYDGKTSIAYKILKLNGKTISKTVLSKDTYNPMNRIVEIGTKKVQTTVTTTPTEQAPTTSSEGIEAGTENVATT